MSAPRRRRWTVGLVAVACCSIAGGCGDAASTGATQGVVARPEVPRPSECPSGALPHERPALDSGPPPGTYTYRVRGAQVVVGERRERRALPRRMEIVITPAKRYGKLLCFKLQRRFARWLVETETYALGASSLYVPGVLVESPDSTVLVEPTPPLLAISGRDEAWSGTFGGRTHGRFRGRVVRRKTIEVAGRSVRAARVALRVSFAGEMTGAQHSERWFSLRRNLLLRERVTERRRVGLDAYHVRYRAVLDSFRPVRSPRNTTELVDRAARRR